MASGGEYSTMKGFGSLAAATNMYQLFREHKVELTQDLVDRIISMGALTVVQFPVTLSDSKHDVTDALFDPGWNGIKKTVCREILRVVRDNLRRKGVDTCLFREDFADRIAEKIVDALGFRHDNESVVRKYYRKSIAKEISIKNMRSFHKAKGSVEMVCFDNEGTITKSTNLLSPNEIGLNFNMNVQVIAFSFDMAARALRNKMDNPRAMLEKLKFE